MTKRKRPRPELTLMVCTRCRNRATRCTCTGTGAPLASEGAAAEKASLKAGAKNWKQMRVWTEDELRPVLEAMEVHRWQPARDALAELLAPPEQPREPRRAVSHRSTLGGRLA